MRNVLIAGIGGQGTVLAAKVLAQAAQSKGWQVRTAETIGMAQRGGTVVSHVRMGNDGEAVHAPLLAPHTADVVIAFEPGEALRALPFLAPQGLMVSARTFVPAVTSALAGSDYDGTDALEYLRQNVAHFVDVDDDALCKEVGSRKCLNTVLVAYALKLSYDESRAGSLVGLGDALSIDDLKAAIEACVKPNFVDLNIRAVDAVCAAIKGK